MPSAKHVVVSGQVTSATPPTWAGGVDSAHVAPPSAVDASRPCAWPMEKNARRDRGLAGRFEAPLRQHDDVLAQDMCKKFHREEEADGPGSPDVLTWAQVWPPSLV